MKTLQEQSDEAHAATAVKLAAAFEGLKAELTRREIPFEGDKQLGGRYGFNRIGGAYVNVEIRSESSSRTWAPKVEKVRIRVGGFHDKRQFPERKTGFDFKEIVDTILRHVESAKADLISDQRAEIRRGELETQLARLKQRVGDVRGALVSVHHGSLRVEVSGLSEEHALRVMQLLQSFQTRAPSA